MGPPASAVRRSTRPPSRRTAAAAVLSMVLLLSWCVPCTEARLHYHRKHRRHRRQHHHATMNDSHISQPPAAALPPDFDGGDSPAEPPGFPPDVEDAPPPRSRWREKPCPTWQPPLKAPELSPVGAPRSPPRAKPQSPSHSHAKPPSIPPAERPALPPTKSPVISPAKAPLHSHAKLPSIPPAERPALPPAKPPVIPPARSPKLSPAKAHSPHHHAKVPSFSPAKPPLLSPSPEHPPRLSPSKPPVYSPPTALHPAIPPAAAPKPLRYAPGTPPAHAPAKPPTALRPAIPPAATKPPSFAPAKPPRLAPTEPPALPPATNKTNPPSSLPPALAPPGSSPACGSNVLFDVRAFGATGNGSSADDTRAFRAAWKAACSAESATLLVPSDGVFTITSTIFAGPCKPGLTFQIDGVLMPPDGPASWPAADSRRQWIVFYKADGMTLTGKGTIEGNGEEWWNLPCKPHRGPNGSTLPGSCDSPALIRFVVSNDVTVQGLRIENSPQFHLKFDGCSGVRVDGLVVSSPAFSPNTDGVHVENTTSVQILNSRISNGDDCVSIGAGCSGVHVENVTCVHGHGISIGSLGAHGARACVSNVTVRSTRVVDSDNGVRIKTWQGGAGSVSAVEFAAVQMVNVKNCIVIDQYYCLGSGCANQTAAVRVTGVAYRDIRGTYNPHGGGAPVRFACSDSVACTGITMTDVELLPAGGSGAGTLLADPYCWNAYGVMETLTLPPVYCLQDGRPEALQDQLATC
ncbi:hypothetical protein ABZP36_015158 [Zizania latifolia]